MPNFCACKSIKKFGKTLPWLYKSYVEEIYGRFTLRNSDVRIEWPASAILAKPYKVMWQQAWLIDAYNYVDKKVGNNNKSQKKLIVKAKKQYKITAHASWGWEANREKVWEFKWSLM